MQSLAPGCVGEQPCEIDASHNPIGNSVVFLPITISGALIRATEIALRSPLFWAGEQVYLTYSNQTADGFGTITGGLTDFSPPSGYYALDHDQRNTLNAGLHAELPWQAYLTMNLYFGSGFSNGNPPLSHLPSNGSLDLSLGKTFGQQLTASLTVLNVTNKHLLIDNSLTFDGYHWNYPRQVRAGRCRLTPRRSALSMSQRARSAAPPRVY